VAYVGLNIFDDVFELTKVSGVFYQGLIAGLMGLAVDAIMLILLKNPEIKAVFSALRHRVGKVIPIGPDTTENPTL
jgi:hypothetical protein